MVSPATNQLIFWQPFAKRFACAIEPSPVCLCVPSVTLVYCGQAHGWIKMPLGVDVDLGPGHIALDGDSAEPRKGHSSPHFSASV